MVNLLVKPLEPAQMVEAYPLVRSVADVSGERWQAYAREFTCTGGGILAVGASEGGLLGLAAYRPVESLRHGRSLQVELIVAFDLSRLAPVRKLLRDSLERAARDEGCESIVYTLAARGCLAPEPERQRVWRSLGGSVDTVGLVRSLTAGAGSQIRK